MIIGKPIAALLATARAFGVSFLLSHQTASQLAPSGGPDLREAVQGNTATKIIFGARDTYLQKWIRDSSGQMLTSEYAYKTSLDEVLDGNDELEFATPDSEGVTDIQVKQSVVSRVNAQDLIEVSNDPNLCVTNLEARGGLGQSIGIFPVRIDWPISQAKYEYYQQLPWPEASEKTLLLRPVKPEPPEEQRPVVVTGQSRKRILDAGKAAKEARKNP